MISLALWYWRPIDKLVIKHYADCIDDTEMFLKQTAWLIELADG